MNLARTKHLSVIAAPETEGCNICFYRNELCDGLPGLEASVGCFQRCKGDCASPGRVCDWTCPSNPAFRRRWNEVGLPLSTSEAKIVGFDPALLPQYLPMIRHGGKRREPLHHSQVAVPTFSVLRWYRRQGRLGAIADSPSKFRSLFRLDNASRVILVSVAKDPKVEQFWSRHRQDDIVSALAQLGISGMTVPNFSFFEDAPRIHNVWNRWRMIRVGERLSAAGIAAIPHLNAIEPADWDFWAGFLKEHSHLCCIAKEFQTGNGKAAYAREAIDDLRNLEQRLGRGIHPLLIGARFVWGEAKSSLRKATLVDSVPFMETVHRRELVVGATGKRSWRLAWADKNTLLDARLTKNIAAYDAWIQSVRAKPIAVPRQLLLRLRTNPSDPSAPPLASVIP